MLSGLIIFNFVMYKIVRQRSVIKGASPVLAMTVGVSPVLAVTLGVSPVLYVIQGVSPVLAMT